MQVLQLFIEPPLQVAQVKLHGIQLLLDIFPYYPSGQVLTQTLVREIKNKDPLQDKQLFYNPPEHVLH